MSAFIALACGRVERAAVERVSVVTARTVAIAAAALLAACTPHPHALEASRIPVAVTAAIELEPLDLSPDGEARLLVRLRYGDASGGRAHIPPGGHVDVLSSRGTVQWQPRVRYGDPAAIVRLTDAGPLTLRVTSDIARVPRTLTAVTNTRAWRLPAVTARALGPHDVWVGWFPRVVAGRVHIARLAADGTRVTFDPVDAPASSFDDPTVVPGAQYTYEVRRPNEDRVDVGVGVPAQLPHSGLAVMRGKAMWLALDNIEHWDVDAMLARAAHAGIHMLALRLTYGEDGQITTGRKPIVDRFIDGAAARGIAVVAWTVPRAVTFEDLAANVVAAAYRTPAGHGLSGVAVDLERGSDFLDDRTSTGATLADYIRRLRTAVGRHVLLVATVEDPYLERLTDDAIPYRAIARDADVLQPMTYWRMREAGASVDGMRRVLMLSYARLRRLAGPSIPINIGGQAVSLGNRLGAPPADEVAASIVQARSLGAIGETLYDWDGTSPAQWDAIVAAPWPIDDVDRRMQRPG